MSHECHGGLRSLQIPGNFIAELMFAPRATYYVASVSKSRYIAMALGGLSTSKFLHTPLCEVFDGTYTPGESVF